MNDPHHRLDRSYEFDESPVEPTGGDAAFDAWLLDAAPAINAPGSVPVAEMWTAIAAARSASGDAPGRATGRVLPFRPSRWSRPAAIAATLLLGVAIDRLILTRGERETDRVTESSFPEVPASTTPRAGPGRDAPSDLYRLAAVQTLSQAEALLTAYRAGRGDPRHDAAARHLGGWAREVLGSTRLLIDSPAGSDAQLRPLLNDIELVLVQIVRLSGTPLDSTDRALIDRALRDRDLLPRIRTAVPAGLADPGIASDD